MTDASDYTIKFLDGGVELPDWQLKLLPRGTKYVDLNYQEWVDKVANQSFVGVVVKDTIGKLLELHFQRS